MHPAVGGRGGAGSPQIDHGRIYCSNPAAVTTVSDGALSSNVRKTEKTRDVTPAPYNVLTTLSDYGGGDYLVQDGTIYFSNAADQRLYLQRVGSTR